MKADDIMKEATLQLRMKAESCEAIQDILELGLSEGLEFDWETARIIFDRLHPPMGELSDEHLALVTGGKGGSKNKECSHQNKDLLSISTGSDGKTTFHYRCSDCKKTVTKQW